MENFAFFNFCFISYETLWLCGDESTLKNKSNFRKAEMKLSIYTKGYYEDLYCFVKRENKANLVRGRMSD